MNALPLRIRACARRGQRGAVSILMAFLILVGVLFILGQTLLIIGTRSVDTSQQLDSNAALMLAESGLQRAQAIVGASSNAGTLSNATCTGFVGSSYSLGRGTFSYTAASSSPPSCDGIATPCNTCSVTATGQVGSASRSLSQEYIMGVSNGVAGRGQTVTMVLRNVNTVPAVALFNLAWKRQDPGGNADTTYCSNGASDCGLAWNLESSNGNTSVGGMGVTVKIPASTISKVVTQNINQSRDYVEVGGLFPSLTAGYPAITAGFWDDKHNTTLTGVNSGATGGVTNGVYQGASGTCNSPPSTYPAGGAGSFQGTNCTNWCRDTGSSGSADTLVYGFSGRSASSGDTLSAVSFNTSGAAAQNIPMTRIAHFPATDGSTANASGKAFSEVWYAYNPDYLSSSSGLGATNYSAAFKGTVGANVATATIATGTTSFSVTTPATAFSDPVAKLCIGDVLTRYDGGQDRFQANTAITTTPDNPTGLAGPQCSRAAGTYGFSPATSGGSMNNPTVKAVSTRLQLDTANLSGTVSLAQTQIAGVNSVVLSSGPVNNAYTISAAGYLPTAQTFTQGTPGTTIAVPSGAVPAAGTIVAVYSGTGQFQARTTVLATPAPTATSFTVSALPSVALSNAVICGGTCAFFNAPATSSSTTNFVVTRSAGTTQFASGFVCLKGVDAALIRPVTATSLKTGRWQESVQ